MMFKVSGKNSQQALGLGNAIGANLPTRHEPTFSIGLCGISKFWNQWNIDRQENETKNKKQTHLSTPYFAVFSNCAHCS